MPDVSTERIALMLEGNIESASGAAAVAVERLDAGLSKVEAMLGPVGRATSRFEAALAKEGATAEEVGKAFHGLVAAIQKAEQAEIRKKDRNRALYAVKQEAEAEERKYQDALTREKKFRDDVQREAKYSQALEKKHQENRFRMQADADERKYQHSLQEQEAHNKRMRAGESPFSGHNEPQPKRPLKERVARGAMQAIGKRFGGAGVTAVADTAEMLEKIGPIAAKAGPALASVATAVAAVGAAAVVGGAYAAKEFGGAVIQAQAYREDVLEAFKIVRRTQGDATVVMSQANRTADYLGVNRAEGAGQFLDLLTKFGDTNVVDGLVRSLADLGTVDPNANMKGLTTALGKMQGQGKLTGETLAQLNDNGLEHGDVLAMLEKRYGKTRDEINKMVSAGKVDATAGREAIQAAIAKQVGGGPAGSAAAAKADRNLSSLIERVKSIPSNILFDVEVGPGIDGVKGVLRDILGFFDTEKGKGKEVRQVAGDMFNALVEGLTGNKVDTSKGITGTLDAVLNGAREAVPIVRELAGGARDIMGLTASLMAGAGAIAGVTNSLGGLGSAYRLISLPFRGLMAAIAGPIMLLPELYHVVSGTYDMIVGDTKGAMDHFKSVIPAGGLLESIFGKPNPDGVSKWFQDIGSAIQTKASELFNSTISVGYAVIDGLVQGMWSRASAAFTTISSIASGIVTAAKAALNSHSPSQHMVELGADTTMGLPLGMQRTAPKAYAAANDVAGGVAAAMMAGLKPANQNGNVFVAGATSTSPTPFITPAGQTSGGGVTINVTFAPVIQASGGKSEVENKAAAAAAVAGSQEEFERMLAIATRRMKAAAGF